jgi:hypothetical protein
MIKQFLKDVVCLLKGHYWVSWHGVDWLCIDCGKRITTVGQMRDKDRFFVKYDKVL